MKKSQHQEIINASWKTNFWTRIFRENLKVLATILNCELP